MRYQLTIRGKVQGVGFRPYVFNLAKQFSGLTGWVKNLSGSVQVEIEGDEELLIKFCQDLKNKRPSGIIITNFEKIKLDDAGYTEFQIFPSINDKNNSVLIPVDTSVCSQCLSELTNPKDRRFNYPFISCTECGPRYSIIHKMPFDRLSTTMDQFPMCSECQVEYQDPNNRRFHGELTACSKCGPSLQFKSGNHTFAQSDVEAVELCAEKILNGDIIALKGLGGYQLICDATHDFTVERLRKKKQREGKPFALMFPNLDTLKEYCYVTEADRSYLQSPESPITIVKWERSKRDKEKTISSHVAPGLNWLGVMLPYTPLHFMLLDKLKIPIIATSGNFSDAPMCVDNIDAEKMLGQIADHFLHHNRVILRPVDDSVVRTAVGRGLMIRRARGYAPTSLNLKKNIDTTLALGGQFKNTIALGTGDELFLSQHIGDLDTPESQSLFENCITQFLNLYNTTPNQLVCDKHPDYVSTNWAEIHKYPFTQVQHHHSHVFSCMLENELSPPLLGVAWDGTGYGMDGTIWGSEFFIIKQNRVEHFASLLPFCLPGGESAIKRPRQTVIGLLYGLLRDELWQAPPNIIENWFSDLEWKNFQNIVKSPNLSPLTSSMGRLFDGVSALLLGIQKNLYEGHPAMALESCASELDTQFAEYSYDIELIPSGKSECKWYIDWRPMVSGILEDLTEKKPGVKTLSTISLKFHKTLSNIIFTLSEKSELNTVALSGGCFQNKILLEMTESQFKSNNNSRRLYWPQRLPPGDGGLAAGQLYGTVLYPKEEMIKQ